MVLKMALLFLSLNRMMFLLKNLDPNGLMMKIKEQGLIALHKILSPIP